jgi:hypothetical protein
VRTRYEPRHARLARLRGDLHRGEVVDIERGGRVEVADRIVADRGQVDDSVEALQVVQVVGFHAAHVLANAQNRWRRGPEPAVGVQIHVYAHDLVSRTPQHRHEDGADVSVMSLHKCAHALTGPSSRPSFPRSNGAAGVYLVEGD